jgi:hypothetical protein
VPRNGRGAKQSGIARSSSTCGYVVLDARVAHSLDPG